MITATGIKMTAPIGRETNAMTGHEMSITTEQKMIPPTTRHSIATTRIGTPLGTLLASAESNALTGLWFIGQRHFPKHADTWIEDDNAAPFAVLRQQLNEYFASSRQGFDLPLAPGGSHATTFQRSVWNAIAAVPFGETISYSVLAFRCGRPTAMRAAGAATGRNPISIVIPCHRIVGSGGDLTGYAGGIERKVRLLELESGDRSPATLPIDLRAH